MTESGQCQCGKRFADLFGRTAEQERTGKYLQRSAKGLARWRLSPCETLQISALGA